LLTLEADEVVTAVVDVKDFGQGGFLTMCTAQGRIKRTMIEEFSAVRSNGLSAINLEDDDELCWVKLTDGSREIILITAAGQALRFKEDDVRAMGRNAAGVYAVKLASGDRLVHMDVVEDGGALLVLSEKGYAKRTSLRSYPTQSRYTRGVATYASISAQTGRLAAASVVRDDEESIGILSTRGRAFRLKASDIPQQGRSTRGRVVVELKTTDRVAAVVRAPAKPRKPASTTRTRSRKKRAASRKPPTRSRRTTKKAASATAKAGSTGTRKRSSTRSSRSRKRQSKS
jgi:DNA gyrase subunit A